MKEKLTILYICIDHTLGGSTTSLYNLIEGIRNEIHPIVLFPSYGSGYDFFVDKGIECHVYPFLRLYILRTNSILEVWPRIWKWHYIKKIRFDYGCWQYVKRILNGRRVDIVHTNTSPNDVGVLLARKLNAKHVWHVREFCDLHSNMEIYKGLPRLRNLINHADARIAISSAIKAHWQMPDKNTWVINNAICSKNEACYIPVKDKYLLFSSYNLTEYKGTRRAIIAFANSNVAKEGFVLKIMGNCEEEFRKSLCETAEKLGVLPAIEFISCQKDVKPFFAHATGCIMASEYEGMGRVTGEAMFFGCPVMAHASGGTLDIVKDGETGYLFETIDECASIIRKVCYKNQENIINNAQTFAIHNLSQEVYGPKMMDVYWHVIAD